MPFLLCPNSCVILKTIAFLTSLKQRFSIPSGCCNFDLPQFHFWSTRDLTERQQDAQKWFSYFANLEKALALFLKMKRSQGVRLGANRQKRFLSGRS